MARLQVNAAVRMRRRFHARDITTRLRAATNMWRRSLDNGGPSGARTQDQRVKSPLLYRLS